MSPMAWTILAIAVVAALIAIVAWLYERSTNEVALVRTGVGGRKVVIDGGALALPHFHEITRVNMQTLRLPVTRDGEQSLITNDRLRVDVAADFYVSVAPEREAVARAAQTLGGRLFHPDQLRALVDGMLVDALRTVAAGMTMDELHENRARFVAETRAALSEPFSRYGLQIDSVSLSALDQTPFAALDENNAFNAVGMRKLAEVIATSKKERAEIGSSSEVSVRRAETEAAKLKLEIDLDRRRAEIAQTQEIETLEAAQLAELAAKKAESELAAAEARIGMEQKIQAADIAREREVREAEIARSQALEIAERDRKIALDEKSQEESRAQAEADAARAKAVEAAEAVETARKTADAERRKRLALISAEEQAEAAAARARIAAESDKATAADRSEAKREEAEALKVVELARAEAAKARIEAENARSEALVAMEMEKARLEAMPKILAEMVKPAEKIDRISVNQIVGASRSGGEAPTSPVNQTMDAIMDMALQLPTLQKLGKAVSDNLDAAKPGEKE